MPDPINITQIPAPRVELIDPRTGLMSREWFRFFNNIYTIVGANLGIVQIPNGGTGLSSYPTNGQLLIGDTAGKQYVLNTLTAGLGIGVTNGAGSISVANTGVLSNLAGAGISVSSATGNVTVANTGVLSFSGGSTGLTPVTPTTGAITLAGTLDVDNGGTGQTSYTNGQLLIGNTTGNTLTKATLTPGTGITISNGTGSITINGTGGTVTSVSIVSANGFAGTVATSTTTPAITLSTTVTGILKGNGTSISAATSGTDYAPATSGSSILYGNGAGGFSNVTIGTGVSFAGGTLSATGTIVQVVSTNYSTAVSNSTSTYADTGLTATITPKFSSSKILVMVDHTGVGKSSADAGSGCNIQLLRGATVLITVQQYAGYTGTNLQTAIGSVSTSYLDSPATTSATTYKTQFMNPANAASVSVQASNETSGLILMEIAQ